MTRWPQRWVLLLVLMAGSAPALALEQVLDDVSGRLRLFGAQRWVPAEDVLRPAIGRHSSDADANLRLEYKPEGARWRGEVAWELDAQWGDTLKFGGPGSAGGIGAGDSRWLDLGGTLADGDRWRLQHDVDRFWIGTEVAGWRVSAGRQAISLGNGIVFQPMDLFSPFSPTEIDRDYKRGEDMLLLQRPLDDGGEVALLGVARRGLDDDFSGRASAAAARYSGFRGAVAFEVLAGRHLDGALLGFGASGPLGTAVWRSDVVLQDADFGGWTATAVINLDWSLMLGSRNAYVFAEYFYNGFGVDDLPSTLLALPPDLLERVGRGELFTLGEHYTALGGTLEWHALWNQQLLLMTSWSDGSSLLQTTLNWDPDDDHTLQLSLIAPLGDAGDEFGGVPVLPGPNGAPLTAGGGPRVQIRFSYYF